MPTRLGRENVEISFNKKNMEHDEENIKDSKLPEFESRTFRFLAKYFPWPFRLVMRYDIRKQLKPIDKAHKFFSGGKRVDIVPLRSGTRGFMMIIDRNKALYFYQDGDGFRYDGCEMGEYEKGDIAIFDDLRF